MSQPSARGVAPTDDLARIDDIDGSEGIDAVQ
jgi:hypothetical protein